MTVAVFANDTLTLRKIGVEFSVDLGELAAKDLRDQLLERYPVESEATPAAGPLHEVTLAEARPGDIATFEIKPLPEEGKFVCTLKKNGDAMTLYADEWLTANKLNAWCIRTHTGDECTYMKDLHIWRWDGVEEAVEEAVELPEEPTVAGWYTTATSDQVLYNDGDTFSNGDTFANWSRPHGAKWSTGNTYESWSIVVRDLGPERLPLKIISKKGVLMNRTEPSISEREAEQQYPTQYWEGTKIKRSFDMTTDDLQDAYMRGREAEPCAEQVEAVARILFEESWNYRPAPISFDVFKSMSKDKYTGERIERFRRRARMILEAARKEVM